MIRARSAGLRRVVAVRTHAVSCARSCAATANLVATAMPCLHHAITGMASELTRRDTRERDALIDALFEAVWVRGLHVSDAAVVEGVANEIGLPGAALVAQAQTPEIKSQLRAQTDEAIATGVFGVPSMIVGDELFWGYDDFPYLELFLAGKDPVDGIDWQKWSRPVRPSSVRRRFRSTNEGA